MRLMATSGALLALSLAFTGCAGPDQTAAEPASPRPVADRPEDVQPLTTGDRAPAPTLRDAAGSPTNLARAYGDRATVLVFYRGGWCPYCNTHLSELIEAEAKLLDAGFQILAVSPDRPAKLREAADDHGFSYRLLSDSNMQLARAFGLAFRVDDDTLERYDEFGIDLEDASGEAHHLLPVPAVYLIDRAGVVRFAYWNPDHRERLDGDDLLEAARAMADG